MADPVTAGFAAVGMVGSLVGSSMEARAAREEGAAKSAMYQYQAGIARFNARVARENKDYSLVSGEQESMLYGLKAKQQMGAIAAAQGASGIDIDSGSSISVRESQQYATTLDLAQIRSNAARKAYAYEMQAQGEEQQAELYGMAAADAERAGSRKAKASLISGITSVSGKFLQAKQMGVF